MTSPEELFARIKAAVRHLFGEMPDVTSLTYLRFQDRLRGGWLYDLVADVAAGHYGTRREAMILDEDLMRDVDLRIEGIAKVLARNPGDVPAIVERAQAELDDRIRNGYLATVASRVVSDQYRARSQQLQHQAPIDDIEDDSRVQQQQVEPSGEEDSPPGEEDGAPRHEESQAVRDERIKLLFGQDATNPAHQLIVAAWCPPRQRARGAHPGRTPEAMADDLATLSLNQLASAWVEMFAQREKRDPLEVQSLFAGMFSGDGTERLCRFWDPLAAVESWVEEVRAEPAKQKPFHMRIAYLYGVKLNYSTVRMVAQLGPRRLDQLAADFVPEYAHHAESTESKVRSDFRKLLAETNEGWMPLANKYKPYNKVSEWQATIYRHKTTLEFEQLKKGMSLILKAKLQPWKTLCFLHGPCLGRPAAAVAERFRLNSLQSMTLELVDEVTKIWQLHEDYVTEAVRGMGRSLILPGLPLSLQDCAEGGDLAQAISDWNEEARRAVEPSFAETQGVRLFALRHNLPIAMEAGE